MRGKKTSPREIRATCLETSPLIHSEARKRHLERFVQLLSRNVAQRHCPRQENVTYSYSCNNFSRNVAPKTLSEARKRHLERFVQLLSRNVAQRHCPRQENVTYSDSCNSLSLKVAPKIASGSEKHSSHRISASYR